MRQLIVKYDGQCAKCGTDLEQGQAAMYEKSMGIFCVGCEPKDTEEIRACRLAKAERKAERYEGWAEKREQKATAQLNSYPSIRHDYAFNTQPGHIPFRAKMIASDDRAFDSLRTAKRMRDKAESLRNVRIAGDAENRRQTIREKLDTLISKGSKVYDAVFGPGEVLGVYKKSYRVKFTSKVDAVKPFICARDKSYVRPL
uniref:Uncharacterized protein n=1 Tax=viral metagenome TaxID=1070528 RepID=A0A6M3LVB4_9ZZZZ